jgi:hypothetical protein
MKLKQMTAEMRFMLTSAGVNEGFIPLANSTPGRFVMCAVYREATLGRVFVIQSLGHYVHSL